MPVSCVGRLNITYPMLFKLTNKNSDRMTHCGVLEFVADEGICYLPHWVSGPAAVSRGSLLACSCCAAWVCAPAHSPSGGTGRVLFISSAPAHRGLSGQLKHRQGLLPSPLCTRTGPLWQLTCRGEGRGPWENVIAQRFSWTS